MHFFKVILEVLQIAKKKKNPGGQRKDKHSGVTDIYIQSICVCF